MLLHEQIREARIERGLSQLKLSQMSRVPRSQLRKFENGEGGITMTTFFKIIGQLPNLHRLTIGPTELQLQHVDLDATRDKLLELIATATGILAVLQSVRPRTAAETPAAAPTQPSASERRRAEELNALALELAKGAKT
jgi:transcriptional regulator with XRE-family HTH domain